MLIFYRGGNGVPERLSNLCRLTAREGQSHNVKHGVLILEPKHFTTIVNTTTQLMSGLSVINIPFIVSAFDINERGMFALIIRPTDFLILAHISNIKTMINPVKLMRWSPNSYLVLAAVRIFFFFFTFQSIV